MNDSSSTRSMLKLCYDIVREEGVVALFRGWFPAYFRLGPHAIICFPIFERLRKVMGLEYL
jgi:solute carrier family 25 (mitochondrial dicarboxylate transporter), member 10